MRAAPWPEDIREALLCWTPAKALDDGRTLPDRLQSLIFLTDLESIRECGDPLTPARWKKGPDRTPELMKPLPEFPETIPARTLERLGDMAFRYYLEGGMTLIQEAVANDPLWHKTPAGQELPLEAEADFTRRVLKMQEAARQRLRSLQAELEIEAERDYGRGMSLQVSQKIHLYARRSSTETPFPWLVHVQQDAIRELRKLADRRGFAAWEIQPRATPEDTLLAHLFEVMNPGLEELMGTPDGYGDYPAHADWGIDSLEHIIKRTVRTWRRDDPDRLAEILDDHLEELMRSGN